MRKAIVTENKGLRILMWVSTVLLAMKMSTTELAYYLWRNWQYRTGIISNDGTKKKQCPNFNVWCENMVQQLGVLYLQSSEEFVWVSGRT